MEFDKSREGTGTKEWSEHSYNIQTGCKHDCLYCYARANALRFKQIASREEWTNEVIREKAVNKKWGKKNGIVMFPSTHDITPDNIEYVVTTLWNILSVGNEVLIVSKPHFSCIKRLCDEFFDYKEQIMFRFTIGSANQKICELWEPGAPSPYERLSALEYAYNNGFKTSVSMEPMLSGPEDAYITFNTVERYVTDTVWIGKMNKPRSRVDVSNPENFTLVSTIEILQNDDNIMSLVKRLYDNPKARWKDSIKRVIAPKE